ncbi:MAG TPA: outer membrane protein assembly factor BamD [Terriglobales bacterium]|nr:outer membrane protein assembly factor BamD [Terriglobales bacterium]
MIRRSLVLLVFVILVLFTACTNKKVNNPLADVGSKQPDKVLFDRAMDAMKHNRFDVARMTLQTLINTYPDSEYVARAKLAVGDSWYAEGGSAALAQAEIEYKDFQTFFPNMPEAAEAQLKIANIHYQQMEKPDRDYTHAMRAEEEYRNLILQYPDNKLVPEAKQRLREVQEVLAEREFEIGRFYYMRQSYPAAIARLQSVVDRYPLYSGADEALYLLGQAYEGQIALVRGRQIQEAAKSRLIESLTKSAADAYDKILTRYPLTDRVEDATARLQALHQPVPKPTSEAIARNKAEEDSRHASGMMSHVLGGFKKHPDVALATKVGEPPLTDPQPVSARDIVQQASEAMIGKSSSGGKESVAAEVIKEGTPPANASVPHSDNSAITSAPDTASRADPNELKPNVPADPNELKVDTSGDNQTAPAPPQVNEIGNDAAGNTASSSSSDSGTPGTSTSKHKKKKGIHKVIPF